MKCEHLFVQIVTADLAAGEAQATSQLWTFPATWVSQLDASRGEEQEPDQTKSWKIASEARPNQTFAVQRWPIVTKWFREAFFYEDGWTLPPWTLFVSVLPPVFVPEHTDLELQWDDRKAPSPSRSRTDDARLVQYWVLPEVIKGDQHVVRLAGVLRRDKKKHAQLLAGTNLTSNSLTEMLRGYLPDAVEIATRVITAST